MVEATLILPSPRVGHLPLDRQGGEMNKLVVALALAVKASAQEPIDAEVARFYAGRWWQPAWVSAGRLSPQADVLLAGVGPAGDDGLGSAGLSSPELDWVVIRD